MIKIKLPLIIVNFKTFKEAMGRRAITIAKQAEKVSIEVNVCIAVAPQLVDLSSVAKEVSIPVFAQHIDPIIPGSFTGHILPEAVKEAGAIGAIIGHAEREVSLADIFKAVKRARDVGLISVVCCGTDEICAACAPLRPNMIALEPPELIGTNISVSKAKPHSILKAVKYIKSVDKNIGVLCGAGIKTKEDVIKAMEYGAEGIMVGSIVKAKNFYNVLLDLAEAMNET